MTPGRWMLASMVTTTLVSVGGQTCTVIDSTNNTTTRYDIDGIESNAITPAGVVACCKIECGKCQQKDCDGIFNPYNSSQVLPYEECCPEYIISQEASCVEAGEAPCTILSDESSAPTPGPTLSPTATVPSGGNNSTGDCAEGTSSGVIALAVLLAALLLGNAICCFKCRKRSPTPLASVRLHDPNTDEALGRLEENLQTERNRRIKAEALVYRAKAGGIRPGDFPSVRDVDRHVEKLADHAFTWTEKACDIGGTHLALPATTKSVLENTFLVCREEVKRCLDLRLQSLSEFMGNDEPIVLSGGDAMNLDTQYVLYEILCRNFQTIVPVEPDRMAQLAGIIQQRCGGGIADEHLASDIIFGDAWPSFEKLLKSYIWVFVEMSLQNPPMDFDDDLGNSSAFDPVVHRDWAQHLKAPVGSQCCIVFPAILRQEGRPETHVKIGVVRLPAA